MNRPATLPPSWSPLPDTEEWLVPFGADGFEWSFDLLASQLCLTTTYRSLHR